MARKTSTKDLRDFGLLVGIVFPLLIGWIIPSLLGHSFRSWTLFIGIPMLILGINYPIGLKKVYKLWMLIGNSLGWVNSKLILGLIFILVVQPMSLIMKLFGYNPLTKKNADLSTYRELKSNQQIDLTRIF